MISSIQHYLPDRTSKRSREQAVALVAAMVGALIVSRAVPDDEGLASELLDATLASTLRALNS